MKRLMLGAVLAILAVGTTWIVGQEPAQTGRTRRAASDIRSTSEGSTRGSRPAAATSPTAAGGLGVLPADPNATTGLPSLTTGPLLTETFMAAQGRNVVGQVYSIGVALSDEQVEELQELRDIVEELRSEGKTDEEITNLRTQAKEILGKQIDRDVQQRQKKLAEIERRAAELRKQLEARQQNKEKTIEMLLMLAENPGAGLGIPNEWLQSLMQNHGAARYYFNPSGQGASAGGGLGSSSIGSSVGGAVNIEANRP